MKRQCAWCRKDMGETEPLEDTGVTHAICPECTRRVEMECRIQKFSQDDAERAARDLDINIHQYPGLLAGMNHELEHCSWTEGDPTLTARIALDHLKENPEYYNSMQEDEL